MNKILLKSAICLTFGTILSLGFTLNAQAQIAKQGKFEMIGTYQLTYLDQNDFDGFGMSALKSTQVNLNKAGRGFFHNTSSECVLVAITGDFFGYCVTTDLDGDRFYSKAEVVGGQVGTTGSGRRATFLGGTGKYEGIEGAFSYSAIYAPRIQGQLVGHIEGSGEYRIP